MVKFLNFIYGGKIKLREKFSGIYQVNSSFFVGMVCFDGQAIII